MGCPRLSASAARVAWSFVEDELSPAAAYGCRLGSGLLLHRRKCWRIHSGDPGTISTPAVPGNIAAAGSSLPAVAKSARLS